MNKNERKEAARAVVKAIQLLPPDKQGYIIGYAQGVIDASDKQPELVKDQAPPA